VELREYTNGSFMHRGRNVVRPHASGRGGPVCPCRGQVGQGLAEAGAAMMPSHSLRLNRAALPQEDGPLVGAG